jgi:hypothetical protein
VTCDDVGNLVDASGQALSALVDGEPNRVWVTAYNDSIPFAVLNNNRIPSLTNLSVLVGYLEGSTEREVLSLNTSALDVSEDWSSFSPYSTSAYILRDSLPSLKTTPAGGLNVAVSSLEYDRFGGRAAIVSTNHDLSSCTPAGNKVLYVLTYLDLVTGLVTFICGDAVENLANAKPLKPDTPADGIASAYIRITSSTTTITEDLISEAKRTLTPNVIPGLKYNYIVASLEVPQNYTYIRGETHIATGVYLRIAQGARVVIG